MIHNMKKIISLLVLLLIAPAMLFAQKNLTPVSQTQLLNLQLPQGSKQDKRFISVTSAGSFLAISTEYKDIKFSPIEVYSLPPVSTSGFNTENLKGLLTAGGYTLVSDNGDTKLFWAVKDRSAFGIYFSEENAKTNLYIGKGDKNPLELNPTPLAQASSASDQSDAVQSPVNTPSYVPPLLGRQTGSSPVQPAVKEDLTVVYDLDGNRYNVIKIGEQYWTKENLRTTQYNDTTRIASGVGQEWSKLKYGAYAVYDEKPMNIEKYGLLYNGYAAASGKLCPAGWHVATDKDWNELEQLLGLPAGELERTGERGNIADKLKVPDGWNASPFSGNNSSGFSILPAGSRLDNGEYSTLNQYGNFWTSTVYDDRYGLLYLWNHHVNYNTNAVGRIYTIANNGYSCRCVKDKPKPVKTK